MCFMQKNYTISIMVVVISGRHMHWTPMVDKKIVKEMDVTGTTLIIKTKIICHIMQMQIASATFITPQNSMHLKCAQSVVVDSNIKWSAEVTKIRHLKHTMEMLTIVDIIAKLDITKMIGCKNMVKVAFVRHQVFRRHVANVEVEH